MSRRPEQPVAPHVQAAIDVGRGAGVQPKVEGQGSGPPVAAHVQAAIEVGRGVVGQARMADQTVGRPVAPHVQRAISSAVQPTMNRSHSSHTGKLPVGKLSLVGQARQAGRGLQAGLRTKPHHGVVEGRTLQSSKASSSTLSSPRFLVSDPKRPGVEMIVDWSGKPKISAPRKFLPGESTKRALRWVSTVVLAAFPKGVEIQSYYDKGSLVISSNKESVNREMRARSKFFSTYVHENLKGWFSQDLFLLKRDTLERLPRHFRQIWSPGKLKDKSLGAVRQAFLKNKIIIPCHRFGLYEVQRLQFSDPDPYLGWTTWSEDRLVWERNLHVHAERRIRYWLESNRKGFSESNLGGVKRPCAVCAVDLRIRLSTRGLLFTDPSSMMRFGRWVAKMSFSPDKAYGSWLSKRGLARGDRVIAVSASSTGPWNLYRASEYRRETILDYKSSRGKGFSFKTAGKPRASDDTDSESD